ncbi:hypothetical protein N4R57_08870 [Rhodobacteraceae bacterium D3-12]|nr:hypothetical protein N4R57_08870 [Rhodobacteraceae bacterium D3-12]
MRPISKKADRATPPQSGRAPRRPASFPAAHTPAARGPAARPAPAPCPAAARLLAPVLLIAQLALPTLAALPTALHAAPSSTRHCTASDTELADMLAGDWRLETLATRNYLGERHLNSRPSDYSQTVSLLRRPAEAATALALRVKSAETPLARQQPADTPPEDLALMNTGQDMLAEHLAPALLDPGACGAAQQLPHFWLETSEQRGAAVISNQILLTVLSPTHIAGVQLTRLQNAPDLPATRLLSIFTMQRPD